MSEENRLHICEQKGEEILIDVKSLNKELHGFSSEIACASEWEESEDPENPIPLFKVENNSLLMKDLASGYCSSLVVWGLNERFVLEALAKHIQNDCCFLFGYVPVGWPPIMYKVSKNSVETVTL